MRKILLIFLVSLNSFAQTTDWVASFGGPASDKLDEILISAEKILTEI